MKAAVCYEFGKPLVIEEIEIDPPQAGEVKVKVNACAICHSDIHKIEGVWGGALPMVCGHEAAGIVEEVGPLVTLAQPGDHVIVSLMRSCGHCFFCMQGDLYLCEAKFTLDNETRLHTQDGQPIVQAIGTGAFAEYVVVHESQVVQIAAETAFDSASLLACGVITGLGAVTNTAQVPPGSSAVIIGCGGVGLNSVQGAALCGAQPIIAIDLVQDKLTAASAFGATHTINPVDQDALQAVKLLTYNRGADYVFVTVGSSKAVEQGITLLRRGGTLVIVGMPPDGTKMPIDVGDFTNDGQRILGSKMGSTRLRVDVAKLLGLYAQGRLKLDELITARYPLEEINEAIAAVKQGAALRNVIVFE